MDYQQFEPKPELEPIVKCFWTLQVPKQESYQRQIILPDGCVDMCFSFGDDIKRYTSEMDFIIQPRQMVLGQITKQFFIEPTGFVNTFSVRFYPYGFANLINLPLNKLSNKETPLNKLFGIKEAECLSQEITNANNTQERISLVERFILEKLQDQVTIDNIVKSTINTILLSKGSKSLSSILNGDITKRRQLERKFKKQIGLSPKQLSKAIRFQATLKMMLDQTQDNLTQIAYQN
jgi:hypothetical protein